MNIITAEKAKEMSNNSKYIPYILESTIKYTMEKIEKYAKIGSEQIVFNSYTTPICYWESIKSIKFAKIMENYGYKYRHTKNEKSEVVEISWR